MLTVSIVLVSDFLGLMPDTRANEVELRRHIAESLAVQISMEIGEANSTRLDRVLQSAVERSERVSSIAVRDVDGIVIHSAGEHSLGWTLDPLAESTVEQIRLALYSSDGLWGHAELVLEPMLVSDSLFRGGDAVLKIILLITIAGFIGYFIFLKKVMRELDPEQVLPDRVRRALDSLTDGLLIIDNKGVVMFSNQALAKRIGINARRLTGKELKSLDWVVVNEDDQLPWESILDGSKTVNEQALDLRVGHHQHYTFVVNASPIMGDRDDVRGVMITFNDITELEKKNSELSLTLANLEESKSEIEEKNRELFTMATRDPLTNLFNRRAFFDAFDTLFDQALQNKSRLGCIMLDIDHFKSVNDVHGHGVGDSVIVYLADTLRVFRGDIDVVGRLGGEEFCMLIPDATVEAATQRAEKIRKHIEQGIDANFSVQLSISSSFGVSFMPSEAKTPGELVEFADLALYEAKSSGRNRVVSWHGEAGSRLETRQSAGGVSQIVRIPSEAPPATSAPTKQNSIGLVSSDLVQPVGAGDQFGNQTDTARREVRASIPEATVLVESGRAITQRRLLSSNIETAIERARVEENVMAVVVLDGSAVQHIANNVDFNIGNQLCAVLVDRIKNLLRLADVVSQAPIEEVAGSVTHTQSNEIVVLLSKIDDKDNIAGIVERLLEVFDKRIVIAGVEYVVESNAGISILGDDGQSADLLLQNAWIACSDAKKNDIRNTYSFYSSKMDTAAKRNIRLQTDLYQAIEKNELEVFYQPKMDLMSGDLVGFEALLRWNHSHFGLVSPNDFIPMAEKTGLIYRLNTWVMTEVVDQINLWRQSGHRVNSVAVNVSAIELSDPEFSYKVLSILNNASMSPSSLEVEITESIGIDELVVARDNLDRLHEAGIAISVDDFGTGYASLGYLQHFPISRLKIDRLFVDGCTEDEKKARVVRSIITMGNSLGMRVLAEGVENPEQLLFLRDHHCDEIQGFFVSEPVNAAQTTAQLEQPGSLSQRVLGITMNSNAVKSAAVNLPLSGLDAVLSRFPDAANAANAGNEKDEQTQTVSDRAG